MQKKRKYLFITGGVVSSLGKGLTTASIALLLEKKGFKVALLKLDPYLNVDPGTMNPFQHGEVYVTDDGAETDLDLGHYHRYTTSNLSRASTATSGQIYDAVIKRERRGDYLGNTVQVIPHITDEIKHRIIQCGDKEDADVVLTEIGGTVGDIESLPFLEAIRQFLYEHPRDSLNVHLTYVPYLKAAGEVKTKPTQHSVQVLRSIGIIPDMILCRSEQSLSEELKAKISLFCNVPPNRVFDEIDVETSIYEVPLMLEKQRVASTLCELLSLEDCPVDLSDWVYLIEKIKHPKGKLTVGIVGKYLQHQDAYKSVFEALEHGAIAAGYSIEIKTFNSDELDFSIELSGCNGYLVPGGFGSRGWEGMIYAASYCRKNKIPYLGICLGMQSMVVDFARHVLGLEQANSTEIDPNTPHPVISLLSEQKNVTDLGGTMRLGAYPCSLNEKSLAYRAYKKSKISERHRHRYEFNNKYLQSFKDHGLEVSGLYEEGNLCEIVEIKDHPWMVGVQFHPELKSRPTDPHPLFRDFIQAMIGHG
ncbi:MAG: CTP synthase [Chlamydiia bacterium]|nr:CTP synthase [Chlamydiia bacterium]